MPAAQPTLIGSVAARKMVILGDSGVGKSSLLSSLQDPLRTVTGPPVTPTIGVDFMVRTQALRKRIGGAPCPMAVRLQIWDLSGKERFEALALGYLEGANCVMIVYDVTDRKSFERIDHWFAKVRKLCAPCHTEGGDLNSSAGDDFGNATTIPGPAVTPPKLILVGNKADMKDRRAVSAEEGQARALALGCVLFAETAATAAPSPPETETSVGEEKCRKHFRSSSQIFADVAELFGSSLGTTTSVASKAAPNGGGKPAGAVIAGRWADQRCQGSFAWLQGQCRICPGVFRCFGFA